jgi:Fis family transcriptional regulator
VTNNVSSSDQSTFANGTTPPLSDMTEQALKHYFQKLNGHQPVALYNFVLREVEMPLFRTVLDFTHGNQSRAASILGINRGTLRKKLKNYGLSD